MFCNVFFLSGKIFFLFPSVTDDYHFKDSNLRYQFKMDFSYNLELMDLILPPHDTAEDVSGAKESDNCDMPINSTETKTSNKSNSLLIPRSKKTERTGNNKWIIINVFIE